MTEEQKPVFTIEKIYVRDLSVEVPHAPGIFREGGVPQVHVELKTQHKRVEEDMYDASLTVTVTAKVNEKIMFIVEVEQAGIFRIRHVPETEMGAVLGIGCANILFPYVRETVSDAVTRGGFPTVMLNPVNFEALYQQQQQQQQTTPDSAATIH
ncbi:protein-export chaperone SecB [Candidatus Nitrospira neomarina]|uniref:Protein-export chaperone SecB n=1 Tax=Candidatus Nitrospira neomarina TaxID=3020899 RepID=A0AA96JXW2_9BACT|nr:protein-export chaperone SecB [Candidatus Nitrospira neomarina]WNM63555.1 protein-export chaperone SecB [Candidatus Nitrospira neomarina]